MARALVYRVQIRDEDQNLIYETKLSPEEFDALSEAAFNANQDKNHKAARFVEDLTRKVKMA